METVYRWASHGRHDDVAIPLDPLGLALEGPLASLDIFFYRRIRPEIILRQPRRLEEGHYAYFLRVNQLPRRLNVCSLL